jgi:flagellar biosynthesis/type III secretory pathway chaperone
MVSENIATLLDVIEKEQQCCTRLIEVSKNEQQSLAGNDLSILHKQINTMQAAVRELHELQVERKELLESLAKELEVSADNMTLYDLVDHLDGLSADNLRGRFRDLIRTGETLFRVNQQTIYLINFSLDLVERQISAWTGALTDSDGYGEDGQTISERPNAKIVEEKA